MKRILVKSSCLVLMCLTCLFLISCGDDRERDITESGSQEEQVIKNSVLETEYNVEDYANDLLLVSKSDGLLYGAINRNNETVIPVEYDEIKFLKSSILNQMNKQFIAVKYEGQRSILNEKGKKIIERCGESMEVVDYELESLKNKPIMLCDKYNSQFFFYNEKGEKLKNINVGWKETGVSSNDGLVIGCEWISDKCFIVTYGNTTDGKSATTIYDYEGNVIQKWDNTIFSHCDDRSDGYYIWLQKEAAIDKIKIDENGQSEVVTTYADSNEWYSQNHTYRDESYVLGENKDKKLFQSNGTWKYVNKEELPIYDDRFYECKILNSAYLLTNGDQQVCVLTQNGEKVVEYGDIINKDDNYTFKGTTLEKENFFADYKSVCIVQKENQKSSVFFFNS